MELSRLYLNSGGELDFQGLPDQQRKELAAQWSCPGYFASAEKESTTIPVTLHQGQSLGTLGDLPVLVITAGKNAHPEWFNLQDELPALSTNYLHVTIPDATHGSVVFNSAHAGQVNELIAQLIQAVSDGQSLK